MTVLAKTPYRGRTVHPARTASALRRRHSTGPFVLFTTTRHAAASLVNGRFHTFPSGRTTTYRGAGTGGSWFFSRPRTKR